MTDKKRKTPRATWDELFATIMHLMASHATCGRYHAGAVIVKDKRIIATGFNGAPSGSDHCDDVGCAMIDNHCVSTTHAEVNAITSAAKLGISVDGATMYVKALPCLRCANVIANSGIKKVVMDTRYEYHRNASIHAKEQERAKMVFDRAGVATIVFDGNFLQPLEGLLSDFSHEDLLNVRCIVDKLLAK